MYFLNKNKLFSHLIIYKTTFLCAVISMILCSNVQASPSSLIDQDTYVNVLDQFRSENFDSNILKQFNAYLIDATGYNNDEYIQGLRDLFSLYMKSITEFSECQKEADATEDNDSSKWLDEFITTFGKKAMKDHENAIVNHMFSLGLKRKNVQCRDKQAECLLTEAYFFKSLKSYLDLFFNFDESLKDHTKTDKWTSCAKLFLKNPHYPIKEITTSGDINLTLSVFGIQRSQDLPLDMIRFFNSNPHFSKPFDYFKAIMDLKKAG